MITLALSQTCFYFVYLQTPFTHGEDGNPGHSRRAVCSVFINMGPAHHASITSFSRASCLASLLIYRTINSAVRRGAEIDP